MGPSRSALPYRNCLANGTGRIPEDFARPVNVRPSVVTPGGQLFNRSVQLHADQHRERPVSQRVLMRDARHGDVGQSSRKAALEEVAPVYDAAAERQAEIERLERRVDVFVNRAAWSVELRAAADLDAEAR